jgi:hypothetical protein
MKGKRGQVRASLVFVLKNIYSSRKPELFNSLLLLPIGFEAGSAERLIWFVRRIMVLQKAAIMAFIPLFEDAV